MNVVKSVLFSVPGLQKVARVAREWWKLERIELLCHLYDYRIERRYLRWSRTPGIYWPLSSELIFQYHKLEKGLCLPAETRRFFGEDAARQTCRMLKEWSSNREDKDTPVYRAATEALRAWRKRSVEVPPKDGQLDGLISEIDALLRDLPEDISCATPIEHRAVSVSAFDDLQELLVSRRSTRNFDGEPVDFDLIEKAVALAQLSPSACNRQPWHVHFYDDPDAIRTMLAMQNGNSGFGQTVPLLAVVTANLQTFFDASERGEPSLDGGLFLMSFLLALQSLGLSSCCLNWCVLPEKDHLAHEIGQIPRSEKILTFLAIGHAKEGAMVPLSARRPVTDVIRRHEGLTLR